MYGVEVQTLGWDWILEYDFFLKKKHKKRVELKECDKIPHKNTVGKIMEHGHPQTMSQSSSKEQPN